MSNPPVRKTDEDEMSEAMTADEAWQHLCDKDDRTSPEEYPEMCLITREELADYMAAARGLIKEVSDWTLQSSIYEGFTTEIWADNRPRGQRTIAVVRDYQDARTIMAAIAKAQATSTPAEEA